MRLKVCPRTSVPKYLDAPVTHFVSMLDPAEEETVPPPRNTKKHLQLIFSDLDDVELKLPKYKKYTPPQDHDIAAMVKFGQELSQLDDWGLLVHCEAGISRSPAAAITILTAAGYRPQAAFGTVRRVCPEMLPNRRILRLADGALNTGGTLYHMAVNHRRKMFLRAGYEDPINVLWRESCEKSWHPKRLLERVLALFPSGWRTLVGSRGWQRTAINR